MGESTVVRELGALCAACQGRLQAGQRPVGCDALGQCGKHLPTAARLGAGHRASQHVAFKHVQRVHQLGLG